VRLQELYNSCDVICGAEFVYVLPGSCFAAPNFFRVVFCAPTTKIQDACNRMRAFCERHATAEAKTKKAQQKAAAASAASAKELAELPHC
jgi:hypothetical protein